MKLLTNNYKKYHVSLDAIMEFEEVILRDLERHNHFLNNKTLAKLTHKEWFHSRRSLSRIRFLCGILKLISFRKKSYFTVLMGANFLKCFPAFCGSRKNALYLFDTWDNSHMLIKEFAETNYVDTIFFSSSQSAEKLKFLLPDIKCHWVPEGIDPRQYTYNHLDKKDIDVLSLGRKYDKYHNEILASLAADHITYLYEKKSREIIFKSRHEFIDGLARTKISICFPSSLTHPERSGQIETMTLRYLQSAVSKCLILGKTPAEMIEIFGYNPCIEVDWNDPAGQIKYILKHYYDFIPLIEKNYENVLMHHTWVNRWGKIKSLLFSKNSIVDITYNDNKNEPWAALKSDDSISEIHQA
jgi:hypothetical protein